MNYRHGSRLVALILGLLLGCMVCSEQAARAGEAEFVLACAASTAEKAH